MAFLFLLLYDSNVEDRMLEKYQLNCLIFRTNGSRYNIDFEDWANRYAEILVPYYVIHLLPLAGELE